MSEFYLLIKNSQQSNSESLRIVCEKFKPLLKKYSRKLNYEDSYNDLQLGLLECIFKIPLEKGKFIFSDAYILSYIKKSVYYKYISLSKGFKNYNNKCIFCENYTHIIDALSYKENTNLLNDNLFKEDIHKILSNKEFQICILKFINQYTDAEIAKKYNVSRQAINRTINKIKKKLRDYYLLND